MKVANKSILGNGRSRWDDRTADGTSPPSNGMPVFWDQGSLQVIGSLQGCREPKRRRFEFLELKTTSFCPPKNFSQNDVVLREYILEVKRRRLGLTAGL